MARDAGLLIVRPVVCRVRGGHRWRTTRDVAGAVTVCSRCGVMRHARVESVAHGSFKVHTDLAAEFAPLPSHGPEEIDAQQT
ncbi:MAG TPA: hypothetical protein VFV91_07830 [Gaiellaceae bacterium]|nr:hypothetical protein [Gaiellaceae bacterium]